VRCPDLGRKLLDAPLQHLPGVARRLRAGALDLRRRDRGSARPKRRQTGARWQRGGSGHTDSSRRRQVAKEGRDTRIAGSQPDRQHTGPQRQTCRGTWARVTIGQFRHLALSTFKKHRAPTNIFSNVTLPVYPPRRAGPDLRVKLLDLVLLLLRRPLHLQQLLVHLGSRPRSALRSFHSFQQGSV
jgi:hypothetical protein